MALLLRRGLSLRLQGSFAKQSFSTSSVILKQTSNSIQSQSSTSSNSRSAFLGTSLDDCSKDRIFEHNSRLENVRLTAEFMQKLSILSLNPAAVPQVQIICPKSEAEQKDYQAPAKDNRKVVIFDINTNQAIEDPSTESSTKIIDEFVRREKLECHRLLVIRKKKMKVHRRKRLWKRMWSIWRRRFAQRFKKRELEFRGILTAKVNEAKKFDPAVYVKEYIEDLHYELIPKTYKGGRKPQWLVKELLEADKRQEERNRKNETDLVTKEKLVRESETVEDFQKRYKK